MGLPGLLQGVPVVYPLSGILSFSLQVSRRLLTCPGDVEYGVAVERSISAEYVHRAFLIPTHLQPIDWHTYVCGP